MGKYIHGYDRNEKRRLEDQAGTLEELLHYDSLFKEGETILEAGCGVGAQTVILSKKNPKASFISIDLSKKSLAEAKKRIDKENIKNVTFKEGNIYSLPFGKESFDHIFICFVLEHLKTPKEALTSLLPLLKKGGTMTIIEGDHGSAFFHPPSKEAIEAINCQIKLQKKNGGEANIGRTLYPLLNSVDLKKVNVSPRMVYVDGSNQLFREGFAKDTFTAMIQGVREQAINELGIKEERFDKGVNDLLKTSQGEGVFCYTFFKGLGIKE